MHKVSVVDPIRSENLHGSGIPYPLSGCTGTAGIKKLQVPVPYL